MAQAMAEETGKIPMSASLQGTLRRAIDYAAGQSHREVQLEHLLLALTEDDDAVAVMATSGIDLNRLRNDVAGYLGDLNDRAAPGPATSPAFSTPLAQILGYATLAARQGRRSRIDGAIVLAALIGDGRSMAANFLKAQGLTFEGAIRVLQKAAAPGPSLPHALPPVARLPAAEPQPSSLPGPAQPSPAQTAVPVAEEILAAARERVEMRRPAPRTDVTGPPVQPAPRTQQQHSPPPQQQPVFASEPVAAPSAPQMPALAIEFAPPPALDTTATFAPMPSPGLAAAPLAAPPSFSPPALAELSPNDGWMPQPAQPDTARPQSTWAPPSLPVHPAANILPRPTPPPVGYGPRPPIPLPMQPGPMPADGESRPSPSAAPPWAEPYAYADLDIEPPEFRTQPPPRNGQYGAPMPAGAPPPPTAAPMRQMQAPVQQPYGQPPPPAQTPRPIEAPPRAAEPPQPRLPAIDPSQVTHSIPPRLILRRPQTVEVRIARSPMAGVRPGTQSPRPDLVAARAISVRLKGSKGRVLVEATTPETQWDQASGSTGRLSGETAVWRFTVTALASGDCNLAIAVTARTLGADGVMADATLAEEPATVEVGPDFQRLLRQAALLASIAIGSVIVVELIEAVTKVELHKLIRRLLGL